MDESAVRANAPEVLDFLKGALAFFSRELAHRGFRLPIRFALSDAEGALLREFTIHKDDIEKGLASGPEKLYIFPLVAVARAGNGRKARVKLHSGAVGPVEYLN